MGSLPNSSARRVSLRHIRRVTDTPTTNNDYKFHSTIKHLWLLWQEATYSMDALHVDLYTGTGTNPSHLLLVLQRLGFELEEVGEDLASLSKDTCDALCLPSGYYRLDGDAVPSSC